MKSLLENIRMKLNNEHIVRIKLIDQEDFSSIVRKTREILLASGRNDISDEYLERGVFALKQYYALAMLDPANAHAISDIVDPFWHAHILHSEQYVPFCTSVVGEYMHHRPLDKSNAGHVEIISRLYDYTHTVLQSFFVNVDDLFWPKAVSDVTLICWHKGNSSIYQDLQKIRLLEPSFAGQGYAH